MPTIESLIGLGWIELDGGMSMRRETKGITVKLPGGRTQRIEYSVTESFYALTSIVATKQSVASIGLERVAEQMLKRNRVSSVVAFVFGENGGIEGRIVQRAATMQREELEFYVAMLAREADRFEFLLSGTDRH